MPSCYLCSGKTDEKHHCHGCHQYICDGCDSELNSPGWGHVPADHEDADDDADAADDDDGYDDYADDDDGSEEDD